MHPVHINVLDRQKTSCPNSGYKDCYAEFFLEDS